MLPQGAARPLKSNWTGVHPNGSMPCIMRHRKPAGWSETGGPWVKPEQAMKKLVWSETTVDGPKPFGGKLAQPPSNNGTFGGLGRSGADAQTFYGDSAV